MDSNTQNLGSDQVAALSGPGGSGTRQRRSAASAARSFHQRRQAANKRATSELDAQYRTLMDKSGLGSFLRGLEQHKASVPSGTVEIQCLSLLTIISIFGSRLERICRKVFSEPEHYIEGHKYNLDSLLMAYRVVSGDFIINKVLLARQKVARSGRFDIYFQSLTEDRNTTLRLLRRLPSCIVQFINGIGYFTTLTDSRKPFAPFLFGYRMGVIPFGEGMSPSDEFWTCMTDYLYCPTRFSVDVSSLDLELIGPLEQYLALYGKVTISAYGLLEFTPMSRTAAISIITAFQEDVVGRKLVPLSEIDPSDFAGSRGQLAFYDGDMVSTLCESCSTAEVLAGAAFYHANQYQAYTPDHLRYEPFHANRSLSCMRMDGRDRQEILSAAAYVE